MRKETKNKDIQYDEQTGANEINQNFEYISRPAPADYNHNMTNEFAFNLEQGSDYYCHANADIKVSDLMAPLLDQKL